jgi:hypothetical protein
LKDAVFMDNAMLVGEAVTEQRYGSASNSGSRHAMFIFSFLKLDGKFISEMKL